MLFWTQLPELWPQYIVTVARRWYLQAFGNSRAAHKRDHKDQVGRQPPAGAALGRHETTAVSTGAQVLPLQ
jgi:hypothetical protein